MKIDLHLHSIASKKNGDSIKWPGLKEVAKIINQHKYQMVSFTDHSTFDWKQYVDFRNYLNKKITILPGIEINIITDRGKIGNILYIFREDLTIKKLKKISDICTKKLKKNGITHNQAMNLFNDFDLIIIPHVGKSNHLEISDLNKIKYDAFETTNLKHSNLKKVTKKLKSSIVAFSDTHTWNSFPRHDKLITEIDLEQKTFDSLKKKLKQNQKYIKEKHD